MKHVFRKKVQDDNVLIWNLGFGLECCMRACRGWEYMSCICILACLVKGCRCAYTTLAFYSLLSIKIFCSLYSIFGILCGDII